MASPKCTHRDNPRAFTLAEILVVVLILGIAATIVIPMAANTSDMQARAAARELASAILYAQTYAISTQQPCQVVVNANAESYELQDSTGNVINNPARPGHLFQMIYPSSERFANVEINSVNFNGSSILWFDQLGGPYYGPIASQLPLTNGSVTVQADQASFTIQVEPVTGRVRIN
jgi:prepilin-type N-terminal cleavage/methylation domain-containing protein